MEKILIVGNGLTANLIPEYQHKAMMKKIKEEIPRLFDKADKLFAPFRNKVDSVQYSALYRGDIPAMVFAAKKGTADQSQIDYIIQHYFRILRTSFENLALMMLRQFPPSSSKHMDLYMKHKMMKYPMWRAS